MRPRLVLHAGIHKTGTTAIQRALTRDRAALGAEGVLYPDLSGATGGGPEAHHALAHALAGEIPGPRVAEAKRVLAEGADGHHTIVLSAEAMGRHAVGWQGGVRDLTDPTFLGGRRAYLARLAAFAEGFDVTVLLFFRDLEPYAHAHYGQSVFEGRAVGTFLDDVAANPHRFDYDRHLGLWEEAFAEVRTRLFSDAVKDGLYEAFRAEAGLPPAPAPAARERSSPPLAAMAWFPRSRVARHAGSALDFARSEAGRRVFEPRRSFLWPDEAARRAFGERFVSERMPSVNVDATSPAALRPWRRTDQVIADAAFVRWRLSDLAGGSVGR